MEYIRVIVITHLLTIDPNFLGHPSRDSGTPWVLTDTRVSEGGKIAQYR